MEAEVMYSEIGEGWWPLVDQLVTDIAAVSPDTKYSQIEEKFGTLRVYCSPEPDIVRQLIMEAEVKSAATCEICGEAGEMNIRDSGWYETRCKNHRGVIA